VNLSGGELVPVGLAPEGEAEGVVDELPQVQHHWETWFSEKMFAASCRRRSTGHFPSYSACRGVRVTGAHEVIVVSEHREQTLDAVVGVCRMAERPGGVDAVVVTAPDAGAGDVARDFQVLDDRLGGALGDVDLSRDVP
jgi:hypothetical protein